MEKRQEVQGEPARESGLEDDWKMEVDEEIDSKKKLDEQRKRLQKQVREFEKFTDMDQPRTTTSSTDICMCEYRNSSQPRTS